MKIKVQNICYSCSQIAALGFICALVLGSFGCGSSDSEAINESSKKKLPKLKFHRPKTILAAANRLDELSKALQSDDPIPAPIKFTVIEVIHGKGVGAHSHYHLSTASSPSGSDDHEEEGHEEEGHEEEGHEEEGHEEEGHEEDGHEEEGHEEDDHDDGHIQTGELTHEVEIDAFTELSDVIRWVPKIAASEGLGESDWMTVNKKVGELKGTFLSELEKAKEDSTKRQVFKKHANGIEQLIQIIRPLSKKQANAESSNGGSN